MSASRVLLQGRSVVSRGFTTRATGAVLRTISTAIPRRQFSSSVRVQEELVQTPATGAEVPLTATRKATPDYLDRAIAIRKIHPQTVKADVEKLLRDASFDVKKLQFRVDRFSFRADNITFVELASKEQAQKAIQALNGQKLHDKSIEVMPVSAKFYWDSGFRKEHRMFVQDENTPRQAIKGLLEGRRYLLEVEKPGWGQGKKIIATHRDIIHKILVPFGLEAIGAILPPFRTRRERDRWTLVQVDFETKEGGEKAVEALNEKSVEGKRVWLVKQDFVHPSTADRIGRMDSKVLEQLQQGDFIRSPSVSSLETPAA